MSRPTHRVKATGELVFAGGYDPAALDKVTAAEWQKVTRDETLATLRAERDRRLAASDWTQLADVDATVAKAWRSYRQALRDLPRSADPIAPEWPVAPGQGTAEARP